MFTSVEEGLRIYRATLERFARITKDVEARALDNPRTSIIDGVTRIRPIKDYDVDTRMPQIIVGNKLRGMEEALGLTEDEVEAIRTEYGLGKREAKST